MYSHMLSSANEIILIFDLETNGLPYSSNIGYKFVNNWPRIVQIAWGLYNSQGHNLVFRNYTLKPIDFTISKESTKIHGISNSFAKKNGIEMHNIFKIFQKDLEKSSFIVAHNLNFDRNTLLSEFIRMDRSDLIHLFETKKQICTLNETIDFCRLNGSPNSHSLYKWPKLSELYKKLFNRNIQNAHDAEYDVKNLSKCFFELLKLGIIRL